MSLERALHCCTCQSAGSYNGWSIEWIERDHPVLSRHGVDCQGPGERRKERVKRGKERNIRGEESQTKRDKRQPVTIDWLICGIV